MSSQAVNGSRDNLSQDPAKSLGALDGHSVVHASGKSSSSRWLYVAMTVCGLVGIGCVILGLSHFYVRQDMLSAAFAQTMVGGGILIMIGLAGVVGLVKNNRSTKGAESEEGATEHPAAPPATVKDINVPYDTFEYFHIQSGKIVPKHTDISLINGVVTDFTTIGDFTPQPGEPLQATMQKDYDRAVERLASETKLLEIGQN